MKIIYPLFVCVCLLINVLPACAEEGEVYTLSSDQEISPDKIRQIAVSSPEEMAKYIKAGNDVNIRDVKGNTLLQSAVAENDSPEAVEMLIRAGADVNAANTDGLTSLMIASRQANNFEYNLGQMLYHEDMENINLKEVIKNNNAKNLKIVEALLKAGAEINLSNDDGTTPLMYASTSNSNRQIIKLMIKYGAAVNQINDKGENALIYAIKYSSDPEETVNLLIDNGIDLSRKDSQEKTAYDYAVERGGFSQETLQRLLLRK